MQLKQIPQSLFIETSDVDLLETQCLNCFVGSTNTEVPNVMLAELFLGQEIN